MINIEKLRTLYKFSKELSLQDAQDLLKTAKSSFKKRNNFEEGSKDTQIYFLRRASKNVSYKRKW